MTNFGKLGRIFRKQGRYFGFPENVARFLKFLANFWVEIPLSADMQYAPESD